MTDMELAEEIERHPVTLRLPHTCKPNSLEVDIDGRALTYEENQQIIAALRRGPEHQKIKPTHAAADAFWKYWRENGEAHKHGYYESTWGAINAALSAAEAEGRKS